MSVTHQNLAPFVASNVPGLAVRWSTHDYEWNGSGWTIRLAVPTTNEGSAVAILGAAPGEQK